ncbi:MAG: ACP S-malonyltransferase [Lachnospiraceae bacterium]|nr:ACP S-malonyltransferase [Lachnospiraceae bacterium]
MGRTAFLFAGQGSQYPGMGKELYDGIPEVKELFDRAEQICPGTLSRMFYGTEEELKRTDNTQPCLFLVDLAAATALMSRGIMPDALAGFSLGEIPALAVSGILSEDDAFRLVVSRGQRMQKAAEARQGSMIAVLRMDAAELRKLCEEENVYPVNYNCPGQIVVSGDNEAMVNVKARLTDLGVRFIELAVGGPFHTPYMAEAAAGLKKDAEKLPVQAPRIPLYANRTGLPYPEDHEGILTTLSEQICNSVLFEDTLRNMAADGVDTFIECGPGKTLSGFVKRTVPGARILQVSDLSSLNAAEEGK